VNLEVERLPVALVDKRVFRQGVDPRIEVEQIDGHRRPNQPQIAMKFLHVSQPPAARRRVHNRLLGAEFEQLSLPAAEEGNGHGVAGVHLVAVEVHPLDARGPALMGHEHLGQGHAHRQAYLLDVALGHRRRRRRRGGSLHDAGLDGDVRALAGALLGDGAHRSGFSYKSTF